MNTNENDLLSPEWPGDFNDTIAIFLDDYRRHVSRERQRRAWAGVMFGVSAASAFFAAAWPLAKTALG